MQVKSKTKKAKIHILPIQFINNGFIMTKYQAVADRSLKKISKVDAYTAQG